LNRVDSHPDQGADLHQDILHQPGLNQEVIHQDLHIPLVPPHILRVHHQVTPEDIHQVHLQAHPVHPQADAKRCFEMLI